MTQASFQNLSTSNPHSAITDTDIALDFAKLIKTPQTQSLKPLLKAFDNFLKSKSRSARGGKLSAISRKNYRSDIKAFLSYLKTMPNSLEHFLDYLTHLETNRTPRSSINRITSSLRHFARFLHHRLALPNFAKDLKNIPQDPHQILLIKFKHHLKKNSLKPKTITNYLSDLRHYLAWTKDQAS